MTCELLTKKELAERLGVVGRTIDRYRAAGADLGEVKLPSGIARFRWATVEKAIAEGKFKRRKSA